MMNSDMVCPKCGKKFLMCSYDMLERMFRCENVRSVEDFGGVEIPYCEECGKFYIHERRAGEMLNFFLSIGALRNLALGHARE